MKKSAKVTLTVMASLAVVVSGVAVWQWDNIQAIQKGTKYTKEELQQQKQENQDKLKETIASTPGLTIRDLTEEEKQALKEGTISREELIESLTKPAAPVEEVTNTDPVAPPQQPATQPEQPSTQPQAPAAPQQPAQPVTPPAASTPEQPTQPVTPPAASTPEQPAEPVTPPPAASTPEQPTQPSKPEEQPGGTTPEQPEQPEEPEEDPNARVNELLAEVLVMQQEFESSLAGIRADAASSYSSDMTSKEKAQLALGCMSDAYALEDECDAKMKDIISELESYSPDLAKEVQSTYKSEKSTTKAEYMAEIKEYANI